MARFVCWQHPNDRPSHSKIKEKTGFRQSMTLQRFRYTLSAIESIDMASARNNKIRALVTV